MAAPHSAPNPFALMMNPEVIVQAMECSDRLSRLQRRICRPLDKPLIPRVGAEVAAFDHQVDAELEVELPPED
jgi:hypothetical protein